MKISCDTCPARGLRCDGCMMSVLAHPVFATIPVRSESLDAEDQRVLNVFVDAGLVTPQDAANAEVERVPVHRMRAVG